MPLHWRLQKHFEVNTDDVRSYSRSPTLAKLSHTLSHSLSDRLSSVTASAGIPHAAAAAKQGTLADTTLYMCLRVRVCVSMPISKEHASHMSRVRI